MLIAGLACGGSQDVVDPQGKPIDPFAHGADATVLAFTAVQCPISNRYAPELRRLRAAFRERARFYLVYPNRRDSAAAVRTHLDEFGYEMPAVLDHEHVLVRRAGAKVTPQVAVFRKDKTLAYSGRIDDRYVAFGNARPEAAHHDLEDALRAVMLGKAVAQPRALAIGCAINE